MKDETAEKLALQIAQTWSKTAAPDIWAEELRPLNHAQAEEAYRRLRREVQHSPSIAEFMARYRSLTGTAGNDTPKCPACDDTGWITDTHHPHHGGHWEGREDRRPSVASDGECQCNIVTPCGCREGQRAKSSHYRQQIAA